MRDDDIVARLKDWRTGIVAQRGQLRPAVHLLSRTIGEIERLRARERELVELADELEFRLRDAAQQAAPCEEVVAETAKPLRPRS